MARAGSINYQVAKIIKAHNGIGKSKLESRNSSGIVSIESKHKISNLFHSYKSLDNARSDLTNLAKFAKAEYGIKDMKLIDSQVIEKWIISKDITYNTASNYLSEINKVHSHLNITPQEVAELRKEFKQELKPNQLETRYYKKLDTIQLPPKSQPAFELQRDYGLRLKAATHINIERQLQGNIFRYQEKGGKWSEREITDTLAQKIRDNAIEGKYDLSINTYRDQLRKAIENTGQKYNGTHGIRHTYAQNQLELGKTKKEVSEEMGHSREEIIRTYLR